MAKPLYYRSSNPGLPGVTAKSNKLFEWDGTGSMPPEIVNGKAFMPTAAISGEYAIWADSYTLGYTNEANAAPIFFSDGAAGDAKILEIINSVANRLGVSKFSNAAAAKAWAASSPLINVVDPATGSSSGGSSVGELTVLDPYFRIPSTQDITANGQIKFSSADPSLAGIIQISRYSANWNGNFDADASGAYGPKDMAPYLSNAVATTAAGAASGQGEITFGFNIEWGTGNPIPTNQIANIGAAIGHPNITWGMTWRAIDTSTILSGPYSNVANPTLKVINGIEVYEFVGSMDTGYSMAGLANPASATSEPIYLTVRG